MKWRLCSTHAPLKAPIAYRSEPRLRSNLRTATTYLQVRVVVLQVLPIAMQSTQETPLKPQFASRSRISTIQRPSLVQQPEQFAAPQGPQIR